MARRERSNFLNVVYMLRETETFELGKSPFWFRFLFGCEEHRRVTPIVQGQILVSRAVYRLAVRLSRVDLLLFFQSRVGT